MTSTEDLLYKENLRGKKYMMGVGPWFYTNLAQWNKNWHCPSESLWYDRWKQVMEIMPDFVQIITWNDFGESSYICDIAREQIVEGAEPYVLGQSHAAFRSVLPFLISAYKAGSTKVTLVQKDIAIAWYRTAPVRCIQDNGTVWGQGGSILAACGARDVVSVMAVTKGAASITVAIGKSYKVVFETQEQDPISYFEVPFGSHTTGAVVISMNGKSTVGPEITDGAGDCNASLNAVAIQV
ncbi:glycoside hydrolase family 71 protein [Canariomyces notabilis]|uniref:Glycoside hydrolase family 71 protein n=1 Tax=Canariomyces notabilis TaxID=2074819 RepID=A0AAN6YSJ9_9PEZI|nr:glycoside hydrolase family 71 protein [Canariomyces arenarius]